MYEIHLYIELYSIANFSPAEVFIWQGQRIIYLPHRFLLNRLENMAVDIHRHTDLIMSQQFLYYLRMNTHRQKHRRRTMAQIVKTDMRQTRFLQHSLKTL